MTWFEGTRDALRRLEIAAMFRELDCHEAVEQVLLDLYYARLAQKRAWYASLSPRERTLRGSDGFKKLKNNPTRHADDKARRRRLWAARHGARRAARYAALSPAEKLARSRKGFARVKADPTRHEAAKARARDRARKAYAANPEKYRELARARHKADPQKRRDAVRKWRGKKRGSE